MKFFVISDTHRNIERVKNVLPHLKGVDAILHLGDHVDDALKLERQLASLEEDSPYHGLPVIAVPGNCDGSTSRSDYHIYETKEGIRMLMIHGHQYNIRFGYDRLLYLAEENDCHAILFGHTHIPVYDQIDNIYLINPGSLTRPKDGTNGSYAVITTSSAGLAASIIYYDPAVFEQTKKPQGGFIKGILNYSDRF